MGGTVSAGTSNEELIDNLVEAQYIKKPETERAFRCVDRGLYFPENAEMSTTTLPYRDVAWKMGHLHISAPCIYSEVIDSIDLKHGQSFLNIGSGTGYLSTVAGLLLGINGVNHGVELYQDVVDFARERLNRYMNKEGITDEFEFCPPKFTCGNGLLLPADWPKYDRIYCGAACDKGDALEYFKRLLKVGGILIIPVDSELMLLSRTDETEFTSRVLLPVTFASLIPAVEPFLGQPVLPTTTPLELADLCRFTVRAILRKTIYREHPEIVDCVAKREYKKRMRQKRKTHSDLSDEEAWENFRLRHMARRKLDSGIADCGSTDSDEDGDEVGDEWGPCYWDYESGSDEEESAQPEQLPFGVYMKQKIKNLELPKSLLKYLNLGHDV